MNKLAKEIWIVAAKRTAFGALGGSFKKISAIDLGVHASKAALQQSGLEAKEIDHVIFGNVQQTSPDAIYGARHIGLKAGIPIETPALTVNRLCGSGFQAVIDAAQQILLGDSNAVLCGGTENMNQAPHSVWGLREGVRFGKAPEMVDTLWAALTDSYCKTPMAVTAENLAVKYGITRKDCDAFALASQRRWAAAQEAGAFADEMVPIEIEGRKGPPLFDAMVQRAAWALQDAIDLYQTDQIAYARMIYHGYLMLDNFRWERAIGAYRRLYDRVCA